MSRVLRSQTVINTFVTFLTPLNFHQSIPSTTALDRRHEKAVPFLCWHRPFLYRMFWGRWVQNVFTFRKVVSQQKCPHSVKIGLFRVMEPCVGLRRKCSFWIFVKLLEKIYKDNNNFALKISRKCFIQIYEIAHFCEKAKMHFCFNPSNNLVLHVQFCKVQKGLLVQEVVEVLEDPDALQLHLAGLRQDKG